MTHAPETAPAPPTRPHWSLPKIGVWAAAALVLLAPLVAMQVTDEVAWTAGDFVFAAALLFGALGAYELTTRSAASTAYRAGVALALTGAFLVVWINAAVGAIGSEDDPANLMYVGVLAIGVAGAVASRGRALGLSRALAATAVSTGVVAGVALAAGLGVASGGAFVVVGVNALFAAVFGASAWLFHRAAQG